MFIIEIPKATKSKETGSNFISNQDVKNFKAPEKSQKKILAFPPKSWNYSKKCLRIRGRSCKEDIGFLGIFQYVHFLSLFIYTYIHLFCENLSSKMKFLKIPMFILNFWKSTILVSATGL